MAGVDAPEDAFAAWGVDLDAARARAASLWTSVSASGGHARASRVALTAKNENLYNAYACAMAATTRGRATGMCVGMFWIDDGCGEVRHAVGLRALIAPAACGATAEEILDVVASWRVRVEGRVSFYHDTVARNPRRMSSDEVGRRFRGVVSGWGSDGLADGAEERESVARFALVECLEGYAFGLVMFAPTSLNLRAVDWARKPRHFSAGTRAEIALACVDVATARDPEAFNARDGRHGVVIDPCCGSGTMLYAAWTRGFAAAGGDISPGAVAMAKQNIGHFVARASSEHSPNVIERDALSANAFDDAYGSHRRVRALVSNLPFGRRVAIGGGDGDGRGTPGATASEYAPLLEAFRDVADTHVFISGVPIAETMREMGYKNVSDVSLCRFGRSFMTTALGDSADKPLSPHVAFTVDEALANAAGKNEKRQMERKSKKSHVDLDARFASENALRVAVDVSYEQDSTRARRSVAKQLCECVGVAHREDDLAMTYCSFRGDIADEAREFFFSDRWNSVKTDERAVEEAFDARDVVYLSPDAPEVLDEVTSDHVYVIGGIVDLCTRGIPTSLARATRSNLRARRLPIREFRPEQTHSVLNIDAVVKILCARHRGESWDEVFDRELPRRQAVERPKRNRRPFVDVAATQTPLANQ